MEVLNIFVDFFDSSLVAAALAAWATYKIQSKNDKRKCAAARLMLKDDLQVKLQLLENAFATSAAFSLCIDTTLWDNNKTYLAEFAPEFFADYAEWVRLAKKFNDTHDIQTMLKLIDCSTTILAALQKRQ